MADQRPDGGIISPNWLCNASVYSLREWRKLLGIRKSGSLSWNCYPRDPIPDQRLKMDGWMFQHAAVTMVATLFNISDVSMQTVSPVYAHIWCSVMSVSDSSHLQIWSLFQHAGTSDLGTV